MKNTYVSKATILTKRENLIHAFKNLFIKRLRQEENKTLIITQHTTAYSLLALEMFKEILLRLISKHFRHGEDIPETI